MTYSSSPGTYVLTGSSDRSIRLYNPFSSTSSVRTTSSIHKSGETVIPEGRLVQTYKVHGYEVLSLDVGTSNEHFVSAGGDRSVFLWDVATASTLRRFGGLHGHTGRINAVKFAGESDSVVVSAGFDTSVRIWDTKSSSIKPVQTLNEAKDSVTCLVVRGPEIVAGCVDGRVRSYDVRMGKVWSDTVGSGVTSLDLTKDGKAMLVGGLDSKLRLMDRDSGSCLRAYSDSQYTNTEYRVQSILGGKEKYVLAGDESPPDGFTDGRVCVWDLVSGRMVKTLSVAWGHSEARKKAVGRDGKEKVRKNVVSCVAWREDGWGDQFCVGGTSGIATVYGAL